MIEALILKYYGAVPAGFNETFFKQWNFKELRPA
jgi:hypothetical protein